jgi:hypothetical protein
MIISDLSYLETVNEASNVVGGGSKNKSPKKRLVIVPLNIDVTKQSNFTKIDQEANSEAVAVSLGKGNAYATSTAKNEANVVNVNIAS